MTKRIKAIIVLMSIGVLLVACSNSLEQVEEQTEVTQVVEVQAPVPTDEPPTKSVEEQIEATQVVEVSTPVATEASADEDSTILNESSDALTEESLSSADVPISSLPERSGPRTQTTGTVPHVQLDVEPVTVINDELFRRAYALPGVEDRPTVVSLPGARGMWLSDDIPVVNPQAIVNGREFAHIHPDGSLHAPLPYERALEVAEKGWGERHPWADQRDGWEGFVMLFTPQSMEELEITFQLIVESYNYVTGLDIQVTDIE